MLVSGSSPLTVARGSMWGFLMFAGAAWLVVSWAVMRLQPADIAAVAGPVILFGAVCELLRTLAGTRTWWLNAGLTVIFGATAAATIVAPDSALATPAALVGWYLMVRGAVDVAVGIMTRGSDRVWSLIVTVGVLETGLGYFSAGPFTAAGDLIVVTLGGLAVLRGVADLVTSLRLRELAPVVRKEILELPPDRAAGLAGYSAGHADFEASPKARHRAEDAVPSVSPEGGNPHLAGSTFHEHVVRTTADLDAKLLQAGITGPRESAKHAEPADLPAVPDTPEGAAETTSAGRGRDDQPGKI
ncbi:hypothetical protein ACTI_36900 [Actinoplanes sp. OR16]|uniref:hypothetical protein n=1 Tax=Actinoplanes sp. OR16 TaxID=946334 RepID=UPI000F72122D|nr:hypothetical protein [Actinoplanes sp. OR16]BBH67005.1 hypothetical protein ACTI_36900 [Actinoplanes sp. OR16]